MAGFLGFARGNWKLWMPRHWDLLPVTARTFCVCRRCDGHFRQFAHPFTARPLIYLAHRIPQARDVVVDWPRWYGEVSTRNSFFSPISFRLCEIHALQQIQRDVALAWRVRYSSRHFHGSMRVCIFSSNRGSTRAHVDGSGSPGDSHCGSTLFSRQPHIVARTRTQFVVGHCGVSRNGACGAKYEKASDLTQLTDRWITGMVALSKHIVCARQLRRKLAAAVEPATGTHAHRHHPHSWGRGRTGTPPHRGFAQIRMAATAPAARHPKHMPSLQLGCRTAGTQ
ncbi:hypothetical protein C4B63_53g22 [Trypanosoma cruzi]|uniref:Uncharacterized protein n=1 Tax=Trypanosoma cruzi TaxID=5693 RepID=A0A2V2V0E7_TRYCR|nr:hypothetical protein C4B63_53g22 [Trypanosoma cruzi]